ncbi:MAG: arylsulfatase [Verrucomicrobiae bacterium]|nr:arylsulfatase [Verrucomicrobiae bacterium]
MNVSLAVLIVSSLLSFITAPAMAKPNIVLILADDMGWSDIGAYGGEIETPNLDLLAQEGLRFTRFYNNTKCNPSRASLLTGLYSHQSGFGYVDLDLGLPAYRGFLNDHCVTAAEVLSPAGYATLMTGKWHLGDAPEHWPHQRGFDRFWGVPSGGGFYYNSGLVHHPDRFIVENDERIKINDQEYITDTFTDHALRFIDEAVTETKKPFFLYLAYNAPHYPLQAKPDDIAKYAGRYDVGWDVVRTRRFARQKEMGLVPSGASLSPRDPNSKAWDDLSEDQRQELAHRMEVYAAQIDSMDQNIGRLIAKLKELGQAEDTLILFLSDNGAESSGGLGGFDRSLPDAPLGTGRSYASFGLGWANASNTPFRKFKGHDHEGGIITPLIAHWPSGISARGELRHQVGHVIDLMPTLVEIGSATYPTEYKGQSVQPLEGRSLVPALTGPDSPQDRTLFWAFWPDSAVRSGNWKLVRSGARSPWELYDLSSDIDEEHDLAAEHPDRVKTLSSEWGAWARRVGAELVDPRKKASN